jgi:ferric-dicitrate binding protein FerR (iron transport regulator)
MPLAAPSPAIRKVIQHQPRSTIRRRLAGLGLALAGLLGALFLAAATAQASQPAHPATTTGAMTPGPSTCMGKRRLH